MGNFGVELTETDKGMRPIITDIRPAFGDLVQSGLPFYWGSIIYEAELEFGAETRWVDCGDVDGVMSATVNGTDVGCRLMAPYRFYIGDVVSQGKNSVVLTLHNTAQNLFGPHRKDYLVSIVPCQRRGEGEGAYFLAPFGIKGPVALQ